MNKEVWQGDAIVFNSVEEMIESENSNYADEKI